jgi:hypothetical protein
VSLATHVSGEPAACHRTARQVGDLAVATDRAAASVAHRSRLSSADFGGRSGDAFRGHAAALAERLSAAADRCHRVARALDRLGEDLDEVTGLMARARDTARSRRLVVQGDSILAPGAYADRAQHDAWRELGALVAAIRQLEQRAQRDWEQALTREALAPAPAPASGLTGPGGLTVPAGPGAMTPVPPAAGPPGPAPGSPPTSAAPGPLPAGAGSSFSSTPASGSAAAVSGPTAAGDPAGSASTPGPTTWAAEELGVHAEPWSPVGAGVALGFEEVSDEPR